jgi:hypothetical protein
MPNAVLQQFDSPLQGAELSNPHYRDRQAQVKGRRAEHFNRVATVFPGNETGWQQPDSISGLNES